MTANDEYFEEANRQIEAANKNREETLKQNVEKPKTLENKSSPVTTGQVVSGAGTALKNAATNVDTSALADPRIASAIPGGLIGAKMSGASFNPMNPDFLKYLPKQGTQISPVNPVPSMYKPPEKPLAIYDEASGNRMLTSNWGLNQGVSQTQKYNLSLGDQARAAQGLPPENIVGKAGPMIAGENNIMVPLSHARAAQNELNVAQANKAAQASMSNVVPVAGEDSGSVMGALSRYAPGIAKGVNFVKGALPVAGAIAKGAGGAFGAADTAIRGYNKDYLGAGLSGLATIAPFALAPEVAIPTAIGAAGINYMRDNPKSFSPNYSSGDLKLDDVPSQN